MVPDRTELTLALGPSPRLAAALVALHLAAAAAALSAAALPAAVRAGLAALLAAGLAHGLAVHAWRRARHAVVALTLTADGAVVAQTRGGERLEGRVRGDTLVHPAIVVVRFAAGRRIRSVVVLTDAADADTLRRFRVRLRWARPSRGAPSDQPAQ